MPNSWVDLKCDCARVYSGMSGCARKFRNAREKEMLNEDMPLPELINNNY